MVCVGRNYADHAAELGNEVPEGAAALPQAVHLGDRPERRDPAARRSPQQVEHEAELAVVIGATGARRVDRAGAAEAIFGYTCANDVTARDLQRSDVQLTRAKGFDSFCPLGPWIVTDLDVSDLEVRCEVATDEEVRQLGRTKDMVFDVADPGVLRLARDDAAARRRDPHRHAGRGRPAGRRRRGHRARSRASAS